MTAMPTQILEDNDKAANGSFLYYLHEEDKFDARSFWELHNCLYDLATARSGGADLEPEITRTVVHVYSYVHFCFFWHLFEGDGYRMEAFPTGEASAYLQRLADVVHAYLGGYVPPHPDDDGLHNPKHGGFAG